MNSRRWLAIGVGALLVFGLGLDVLSSHHDAKPYSLVQSIPWLLGGDLAGIAATAVPAGLFAFLTWRTAADPRVVPRLSVAVFAIVLVLSLVSAGISLEYAMEPRYRDRSMAVAPQWLLPPAVLVGLYYVWRPRFDFRRLLVLHLIGCGWLSYSAFPWWGELL